MTSPEGGYEDERFQAAVPDHLHCAICLNVLKQPKQCARNEHFFCQPCITRHLRHSSTCPSCIEPLTIDTLRAARFVKGLISQLDIRCENVGRGCLEIVKVEMLEAHVQNCEFSPVQCSNDGCQMIINRKDQADHEINDCDNRQGKCEVCGQQVAYGKRQLHCYVTKNKFDELEHNLRREVFSMKEVVTSLSGQVGQLTRHMTDMKASMDDMNRRLNHLERVVNENTNKEQSIKQEPQIDIRPSGSGATSSEENSNFRSDVIIAGGDGLNSVEVFSWTTRQWTFLPAMRSQRWLSSSFVYRGHMYVCGGVGSDSIEVLQLGQDGARWWNFPVKLPHKIHGHTCVVYEDSLFIFGGRSGSKVTTDICKISLVAPHPSQVVGHMPEPREGHSGQCFGDKIFIVGGTTTGNSCDSVNTVLVYDVTTNCCQTLAPLPFAVDCMATVAWKDNIIILGGYGENNELNTVVKYNVTSEKSEMLPSMEHKRSWCSAVVTGNVIVVMGGLFREAGTSVECFSFDCYKWEALPEMNERRCYATAVAKCV